MLPMLTPHDLRRLAVAAAVDPRTVTRWLAGLAGPADIDARLTKAAAELGIQRSPAAVTAIKPPRA